MSKAKSITMKTVKRNGITYALVTPSTLTAMKNRLKAAKAAQTAAPAGLSAFPAITTKTVPGTTGSTFTVVAQNGKRTVGYRSLGNGDYRVRVNTEKALPALKVGWSQPDSSQARHSIVVSGVEGLLRAIAQGTFAIFNS